MNAPFDPVSFIHRLEAEGIARGAAEAIAQGIEERNRTLATSADIDLLRSDLDRFATKEELRTALAKQVVQFGTMLAGATALVVAILGTIIALR